MDSTNPLENDRDSRISTARVSRACDRCRRNKSRCDPYRPCSLCSRAGIACSLSRDKSDSRVSKKSHSQGSTRNGSRAVRQQAVQQIPQQGCRPAQARVALTQHDAPATLRDSPLPPDVESRRPSIEGTEAGSAIGIAQKICQLGDQTTLKPSTTAIPGGENYGNPTVTRLGLTQRWPVPDVLGHALPPQDAMYALLEEYFDSIHWFSLVVHEPRFRTRLESVADGLAYPSQKSFLILLSVMLGMGAWYKSHKDVSDTGHDWRAWSQTLMQGAQSQLAELMDQTSVASVQACTLLGSYYVYHGKPNLSFALLGATIKTAQSIRLHRQVIQADDSASIEERKRVWWTIYTWDRFASITYGRPLSINDRDCNIDQPLDLLECPSYATDQPRSASATICYSAYQRELNKLYLAASPMIEIIYGMRAIGSSETFTGQQHVARVRDFTERLWAWHRHLPAHLLLDLNSDCEASESNMLRIHRLQALALQLTFDNLLIIFHRPVLARQVDHLIRTQPDPCRRFTCSPSDLSVEKPGSPVRTSNAESPLSLAHVTSTEQWWHAALRTSKVTGMPQLAQTATDSHLVAFMAINLFNSAIVMAVLALSDPLSDRAQEVKRIITRIYRLMELLGMKTQLSMQSNDVLKDVVQMLLRREADAMLAPVIASGQNANDNADPASAPSASQLISVGDTLRLPIDLPLGIERTVGFKYQPNITEKAVRLNDSLVAVQKVFPNSLNGGSVEHVHSINTASTALNSFSEINREFEIENDEWLDSNIEQSQTAFCSSLADEQRDGSDTGNGLYWVWDNTWDDTQLMG